MHSIIQVAYSHNKIYNQTMNKLPTNWKEVKLGDILNDYIRGPFGSALKRNELLDKVIVVYEQQHAIYNTKF